jgi:outer membrane protein assembly factor BamB
MDPDKRHRFFWKVRSSVLAFDAQTGEMLWRSKPLPSSVRNDLASPISGKFAERETLLWPTGSLLAGVDPADGAILWRFDYGSGLGLDNLGPSHTSATPVISGDLVVGRLWNHKPTNCTFVLRITAEGPRLVWRTSNMVTWYHSYIAWKGMLLGLDNQGIRKGMGANLPGTRPPEVGMLQCYDIETGKLLWSTDDFDPTQTAGRRPHTRPGYILADGKLIIQSREGLNLIAFDEHGARVVGTTKAAAGGSSYPLPSMADGRLYIRQTSGALHCFDLRRKPAQGKEVAK